jgi:hypothetical protein
MKELKLAQLLGRHGVFFTWVRIPADSPIHAFPMPAAAPRCCGKFRTWGSITLSLQKETRRIC